MSTPFILYFDESFSTHGSGPKVVVAEISELQEDGRGELKVPYGTVVINLVQPERPTYIPLWRGDFIVRFRTARGYLQAQRVRVDEDGEDASIQFIPIELILGPLQNEQDIPLRFKQESGDLALRFEEEASFSNYFQKSAGSRTRISSSFQSLATSLTSLISPPRRYSTLRSILGFPSVVTRAYDDFCVARLVSRTDRRRADNQRDILPSLLDAIGDIEAVQFQLDHRHFVRQSPSWLLPLVEERLDDDAQKGVPRHYAFMYQEVSPGSLEPLYLSALPERWLNRDGRPIPIRARIRDRKERFGQKSKMYIEVDDPDYAGLIDFLQAGDLSGAAEIVNTAKELLYGKWINPYAAALGGYVMIHTNGLGNLSGSRWRRWVLNLAANFPKLPDGAILYATLLLQCPSDQDEPTFLENEHFSSPLAAILEALRRGPPVFRLGLKLLSSNLDILINEHVDDQRTSQELRNAKKYVRSLLARVDPYQAFCVFDVSGRNG